MRVRVLSLASVATTDHVSWHGFTGGANLVTRSMQDSLMRKCFVSGYTWVALVEGWLPVDIPHSWAICCQRRPSMPLVWMSKTRKRGGGWLNGTRTMACWSFLNTDDHLLSHTDFCGERVNAKCYKVKTIFCGILLSQTCNLFHSWTTNGRFNGGDLFFGEVCRCIMKEKVI